MAINGIPPLGALRPPTTPNRPAASAAPGFGDAIKNGMEQVSQLERKADAVTNQLASGGPADVHELAVATTKASLGMDLLVQVRNRAVEAYQEVMRLQV